jgi:peptidyl-prolyl cis-trans isomerase B (cyclophilin B)
LGRAQKLKKERKEKQFELEKEKKKALYRKFIIVLVTILAVGVTVFLILLVNSLKKEEAAKPTVESSKQMVMETTKGEIVIDLFTADTPLTVQHVTNLAQQGFYDNLRWYRVEDFVIQTGSHVQSLLAESGDAEPDQALLDQALQEDQGVGTVLDEIGQPNLRGSIAMAKPSDPETQQPMANSARTDFYILKTDASWLDSSYTVFGRVVGGMEVVDSLETTDYLISVQIRDK